MRITDKRRIEELLSRQIDQAVGTAPIKERIAIALYAEGADGLALVDRFNKEIKELRNGS